ncbi:unnamed protein product [Protopolystoma xenopodis]|uniref:Conserved Oligomeric Golgi complex subunit 6 C-terminal domain-containing protein n=1 Tax=Protopolystoma xenopodis TaxID=117903 RepID=A0A448WEI5_9PLAT|nr:unnamed protein product [Protopolystoma xenopodis]
MYPANLNDYLANPDKYELPEIACLAVPRLRQLVRKRAADQFHTAYQQIYTALVDSLNGYSFSAPLHAGSLDLPVAILHTPAQVAQLILNT